MMFGSLHMPIWGAFLCVTKLFQGSNASPTLANSAQVRTSVEGLYESYDYVVVGGGTSGLAVANRLSEDPSSMLILSTGHE